MYYQGGFPFQNPAEFMANFNFALLPQQQQQQQQQQLFQFTGQNFVKNPFAQQQQPVPAFTNLHNGEYDDDDDDEDDEEIRTLYCGNLDERVTEEILYELFLQAGPIERVNIPKDKGRQKTFGFVTFDNQCSPQYAVKLMTGLQLFGKSVIMKPHGVPRPEKIPYVPVLPAIHNKTQQQRQQHQQSNMKNQPDRPKSRNRNHGSHDNNKRKHDSRMHNAVTKRNHLQHLNPKPYNYKRDSGNESRNNNGKHSTGNSRAQHHHGRNRNRSRDRNTFN